jgi:hypothetical protein
MLRGWLWDKKVHVDKVLGFAHLILWISRDLSTLCWLILFFGFPEKRVSTIFDFAFGFL